MNNIDKQYQALLQDILDNGVEKKDRTGTGTISVFGRQIRHKMSDGFPLLTTKKVAFKTMVTELLWFLRGDTNIKYLVDNNTSIWNGDAYKEYRKQMTLSVNNGYDINRDYFKSNENGFTPYTQEEFINKIKTDDEFARKWGELGPVYGRQWRSWGGKNTTLVDVGGVSKKDLDKVIEAAKNKEDVSRYGAHIKQQNNSIDQISNLINDLKTNPDSRRLMVNAWNVGEIDQMTLPPCHYSFQVYTRELSTQERANIYYKSNYAKDTFPTNDNGWNNLFDGFNIPKRAISLMWNQRSVDTFLGLPFNIASYGLLLELIAKAVNMVPDELIGNLGDVHLYSNHIDQAKEQISRTSYELPKLNINTEFWPYEGGSCGEGPLDAQAVFNLFKDANFCKCLLEEDIQLSNYQSHPTIKAPLSN